METVQSEGGRTVTRIQEFFILDAIIAVGYRVNSPRATQFRIWATQVLKNCENFHDRFLVIDDKEIYLIGASLKDLGKKCFAFTRLDPSEIPGIKARI